MNASQDRPRASAASIPALPRPRGLVLMHWLTLLPLLVAFGSVLLREGIEDRALRDTLLSLHQWCGGAVLVLGSARLLVRWRLGHLPPATQAPSWSNRVAALAHVVLYGAMLFVPLLGWATLTASGKTASWGVPLPSTWIPEDEDLADQLHDWHAGAAYACAALIAVHVLAALWHHFVLRDEVLRSMRLHRSPPFPKDRRPPA